ncbi:MAG TPA: dTMP kinase [Bryobacteraceae bacterium]|nr:dTMP kinase [Bryobacteraceae bacterium]
MTRGLFLTFEGTEGSGKSTQMRLLAERLELKGYELLQTAEPGGTRIGKQIRRVLLDTANQELSATAELLLMFASRAQNIDEWILPALGEGKIVLSDRWTDSTLAFQGVARGLGQEVVLEVDRIACRGLIPDLTLYIDIDLETGLARARDRNRRESGVETRIDEHPSEFHRKVRDAYLQLAAEEPRRFRLIDGDRDPNSIADDIWREVEPLVAQRGANLRRR